MKQFLILLITIGLAAAGPAAAQTRPVGQPSVAVNKVEKQAIVEQTMALTESQARAFWPLYLEYEKATCSINNRMKDLISGYLDQYDRLTNDPAEAMIKEYISIEQDRLKLKKKYIKKFRKVLTARNTARFFQLENKLEAMKRAELATEIPLVR